MSTFADRVTNLVRANRPISALEDIEKTGSPFEVAAYHINLTPNKEEGIIGMPRASSLQTACMRMHVIGTVTKVRKTEYTGLPLRITFGIGNAIHSWIQNDPDVFGNRRMGWWQCQACEKIVGFGIPPTSKCKFCGAAPTALVYYEHSMLVKGKYGVTGHPDLFLLCGNLLRVVEIKSLNGDQFDTIKAPLVSHDWQAQTYMWGLSRKNNGLPYPVDGEHGYVMYVSKKHASCTLPIKMFTVVKSKSLLDHVKAKLESYSIGMGNYPNRLPGPVGECVRGNFKNYRANQCPCKRECLLRK